MSNKYTPGSTVHDLLPQGDFEGIETALQNLYSLRLKELFTHEFNSEIDKKAPVVIGNVRKTRTLLAQDRKLQSILSARASAHDILWELIRYQMITDQSRLHNLYTELSASGPSTYQELQCGEYPPFYYDKTSIHRMPSSYRLNTPRTPWVEGCLYDKGVLFTMSSMLGSFGSRLGNLLVGLLSDLGVKPSEVSRVVELGCGVGHATLPIAEALTNAEYLAIDSGYDMARYAQARANLLSTAPVQFYAGDARDTGLEAGSADLVISTILLHELPATPRREIFAESYRLLKKGGLMIHLDSAAYVNATTAFGFVLNELESSYNGEVYINSMRMSEMLSVCGEIGFSEDTIQVAPVKNWVSTDDSEVPGNWCALVAQR